MFGFIFGFTVVACIFIVQRNKGRSNGGRVIPGLYKAKHAKNTIIEVFDEYDYRGYVRYHLKEGSAISETAEGLPCMGLLQDDESKNVYYPKDALKQYFSLVTV